MRLYHSGSRWAVWRWTFVGTPTPYFTRLHLLHTPWFSVMMHWINPDPQPDMHDHPVSFLSLILRGWYVEQVPGGWQLCRWWNFKHAWNLHRIIAATPKTLTLVFAGPRQREWGFMTPTLGWVHWRQYG